MPNYDYRCECGHEFVHRVPMEDRHEPVICGQCDQPAQRVMSAPLVMNNSMPDGNRRFADVKEVAKLERLKANTRDLGEKSKIQDTINTFGKDEE